MAAHVAQPQHHVPLHCLNCGFEWRERLSDSTSCPHCDSPSIWLTRTDIPLGPR